MKQTSEYTADEVDTMRERLHESEWEGFWVAGGFRGIGWAQMKDDTVISCYTEHYGDLEV